MTVWGIIAEYNPFHNGHKFQIDTIKNPGDYVVVVMSGSFTQRGTGAIYSKWNRTKMAVDSGVDLVLELPSYFSCQNAEIFAQGGIYILNSLGIIDRLSFGSENPEELLKLFSDYKFSYEEIENRTGEIIKDGINPIVANYNATLEILGDLATILKNPNNILGFEYLKALKLSESSILPAPLMRKGVNHNKSEVVEGFSSASYIRELIYNKDFTQLKNLVPNPTLDVIKNCPPFTNDYYEILKYKIITEDIEKIMDYEVGLENRLKKHLDSKCYRDFVENVHSKRHTRARIRRYLNNILLGITREVIDAGFNTPYIRVLGASDQGFELIKKIRDKNNVVERFSKINNLPEEEKFLYKFEAKVTDIYNLNSGKINKDYTTSQIIYKNT